MPANQLRGAFGNFLRERHAGLYGEFFEPVRQDAAASGLRDCPRPFVFRANHLSGLLLRTGDTFHFDLHVFDTRTCRLPLLASAFNEFARVGIGPGRGRAVLESIWHVNASREARPRIYAVGHLGIPPPPLTFDLNRPATAARVSVRFLTPTELKPFSPEPLFETLYCRARDRIGNLRALYGSGPLAIDLRESAERARNIRLIDCHIDHVEASRRSSRTGAAHPLGGFTGEAVYEGSLGEFLPYLEAAEWTGVGRQTVWGKGELRVTCLAK